MQTVGARILPEDEPQGINREAVLLEWERKIEEAERLPGRFERSGEEVDRSSGAELAAALDDDGGRHAGSIAPLTEDATHPEPRRFRRSSRGESAAAARRTITITGQPVPRRRRRSVVENQLAQPDRIALWAFLLGLFLVAVAAGTAHA
jgi:hypothetical protein